MKLIWPFFNIVMFTRKKRGLNVCISYPILIGELKTFISHILFSQLMQKIVYWFNPVKSITWSSQYLFVCCKWKIGISSSRALAQFCKFMIFEIENIFFECFIVVGYLTVIWLIGLLTSKSWLTKNNNHIIWFFYFVPLWSLLFLCLNYGRKNRDEV